MKFGFYKKNDPDKEIIITQTAENIQQATVFFAAMKGLSVEKFLDIFAIKNIKE